MREVGIDGKVARMSNEPLLKSWAAVERAMAFQKMHEYSNQISTVPGLGAPRRLHDFDEEVPMELLSGTLGGGQDLASYFRRG